MTEKLLEGLHLALANRFMCVRGLPMVFAQTGEKYVQFSHEGRIPEDKPMGWYNRRRTTCFSAEHAIIALSMHIAEYCLDRQGSLYWRIMPEVDKPNPQSGWDSYARLLVSDKPVIWASVGEYEATLPPSLLEVTA